jgi:hypothetical protein
MEKGPWPPRWDCAALFHAASFLRNAPVNRLYPFAETVGQARWMVEIHPGLCCQCATISATINQQKWQCQEIEMAAQNWPSQSPFTGDPTPPPPPLSTGYELRPLSVGEVLDRVFSLYRAHFWFLAGLSALSAGVLTGIEILRLIYLHFSPVAVGTPSYSIVVGAFAIVQGVVYMIAYSLTLAATTSAVNSLYLGEPTSLGIALRIARHLWLRCLGISFWQGWSAAWVFVLLLIPFAFIANMSGTSATVAGVFLVIGLLASFVYGVIAYLRNSLAVPSAVVEDLGVRAAMRRSKRLAAGRIGRIFLLFLLMYALSLATGIITVPLAFLLVRSPASEHYVVQGIILAVNFISTSLVGPIVAIGLCLFYFDERVRREGFDIDVLLRGASIASQAAAPPPTAELPAGPLQDSVPTTEQN